MPDPGPAWPNVAPWGTMEVMARLPRFEPMLASTGPIPSDAAGMAIDVKFDGSPHNSDLCQAGVPSGMGSGLGTLSIGPVLTVTSFMLTSVAAPTRSGLLIWEDRAHLHISEGVPS